MAVEQIRTFHQEIAVELARKKLAGLIKLLDGDEKKEELDKKQEELIAWTTATEESLDGKFGKLAVLFAYEAFNSGQELSLKTDPETINWELVGLAVELGKDRK